MTLYDQVSYEDEPFSNTHPETLSAIGTLYGLAPASPNSCRFLELGAAKGNNIIGMAYALPNSEFIGIDLSEKQVEEGIDNINKLGLKNVQLKHADILDLDEKLGKFDYIIAHGILSWVPEVVRDKMFELCSKLLTSNGICYFSYNTYPGWKAREIFRDIMLIDSKEVVDTEDLINKSRRALKITSNMLLGSQSDFSKHLKEEIKHFISRPDWYFLHDFLAEINNPFYISEIFTKAKHFNLQYLVDTELSTSTTMGLDQHASQTLNKLKDDLLSFEQYADIARLRSFRRSLFCRKEIKVDRNCFQKNIYNLFIATNLIEKEISTEAKNKTIEFSHPNGGSIRLQDPAALTALRKIISAWPVAISVSELINNLSMSGTTLKQNENIIEVLINGIFANLIEVRSSTGYSTNLLAERPIASKLARQQALTKQSVTTLLHHSISIDNNERELLILLDGTRTLLEVSEVIIRKNPELNSNWIKRALFKFLKEGLLQS